MFHLFPKRERYHLTPDPSRILGADTERLTRYKLYQQQPYTAILGDQNGVPVFCDLATAPHVLIAGATGSGKSVCLNSILCSMLLKNGPAQLALYLIDPKMVELARYRSLPHLSAPIATDLDSAEGVLQKVHREMMARYADMSRQNALHADLLGYRHLLLVMDEFASLMSREGRKRLMPLIQDIARLGRAAGVHLILATQRPTRDVVDGQIKANCPTRICFRVLSATDSRVILDTKGGETLRGAGDGLYRTAQGDLYRFQGCFCSDGQVEALVRFWAAECRIKRYRTV